MKTATVTWTTDNNYGTLLQAYALQQKIIQMGHENVILSDDVALKDIRSRHLKQRAPAVPDVLDSRTVSQRIWGLATHPKRLRRVLTAHTDAGKYERPYHAVQEKCDEFRNHDLLISELSTVPRKCALDHLYDAFVCGSDQIWSVLARRIHPYYFLQFTGNEKIAYAPSMGTTNLSLEELEIYRQYLSEFDSISVREKCSSSQLSDLLGRAVPDVADPTLLHTPQFWKEFASDPVVPRKKYLLCYFLENKPWYFSYAKKIARKKKLKIFLIPNKIDFLNSEYLITDQDIGPREFVGLFHNASYVLTDSYHGSIFSVLFEKGFQYLLRFAPDDPRSQNIRIQSLFDRLGLNDRIIDENMTAHLPAQMDYRKISENRTCFQRESEEFLRNALKHSEEVS